MTNPICPPRPPARLNVENLSIVNRSTTTIQLNAKCVEKVVFKSMELVQDKDRISAIKFNFSVIYTVHTYENLKGIYQKTGGKIHTSSNQTELFSYSESNMVTTKSQLIHELPSEMVKEVFFESMRWYSNTSGTLIEFKFTEDSSKALENKKQKVSNENLGQNSSSHYLETFSKKSIIDPDDEVFPNQLSSETNTFKKTPVTEVLSCEKLKRELADESFKKPCSVKKEESKPHVSPFCRDLSYKSGRLASIPEEDEEPVYEELKVVSASSESISSNRQNELKKNTFSRSISDMHFPDAKTPKKSKNPLRKLMNLFGKCITRNSQNNVLIKSIDHMKMQISESPIYDKTPVKERTISEDSGYDTPLSSPGESISIRLSDFC